MIGGDGGTDHRFRHSLRIDVRGADEVDARVLGRSDDTLRGSRVGAIAEHHRSNANLRHFETAVAEAAKLQRDSRQPLIERQHAEAKRALAQSP